MFWLTSSIVHLPKTEVLLDLLLWITKQLLGHHQLSLPYMRTFISLEYLHCYVPTYLCLKWVLCAKIELGEIRCSWHILMLSTLLIRAFLCLLGCLNFFSTLICGVSPLCIVLKSFAFSDVTAVMFPSNYECLLDWFVFIQSLAFIECPISTFLLFYGIGLLHAVLCLSHLSEMVYAFS